MPSLWADEQLYYPVEFEPYTPKHWFDKGAKDQAFRSKPEIALDLVKSAIAKGMPFRAVMADSFYGENFDFRDSLQREAIPYVLALYPSHSWWHFEGEIGSGAEIARSAPWQEHKPGEWLKFIRRSRDSHEETWWLLEGEAGPYGKEKPQRLVIATTDPASLPELSTCYLVTNLPAPGSTHAEESELETADLAEVVRLYGLRIWVEQSYKQVKQHLGWAQYQVRKAIAMRRHWQRVCCAFSFCWWALAQSAEDFAARLDQSQQPAPANTATEMTAPTGGENKRPNANATLARGATQSESVARALPHAQALLASLLEKAPAKATAAAP